MRMLLLAATVAASLAAPCRTAAFMIVPLEEAPGGYVVVVEGDLGDMVPFSGLPPAFRAADAPAWQHGLTFVWQYFRSSEIGRAVLVREEGGKVSLAVELSGDRLADGDTLGMAFTLASAEGEALHTTYLAAGVKGAAFEAGAATHRVREALEFDGGRWDEVGSVIVFTMKYYAVQNPGPDGVRAAMQTAVERTTGDKGSSQWLGADPG